MLQGVAWAGMLRQYAQASGSIAVAVEQTFDGEHPCELCRHIAVTKSKGRPGSPGVPSVKKDAPAKALLAENLPTLEPLLSGRLLASPVGVFLCPNRTEAPPTPPPRCVIFAA